MSQTARQPDPDTSSAPDRRPFIAAAALLLLLLGAYANFFRNAFHFDDSHVIVENAAIHSLSNVLAFFTDAHTFSSQPTNATYRPLVTLSFAIDYAIAGGLDPLPFHVTQLLLLIIVGVLLAVVCTHLFGRSYQVHAIVASGLFCVHTANTETMNFLSSRSELISAIGFLVAFLVFVRGHKGRETGWYLIPLAIAALAKAPVVIFAAIAFAWVRIIERRSRVEAAKAAAPSFLTGVALLMALHMMNAPEWISGGGPRWRYLFTQGYVWLHYARLTFLPIGLTADTDMELLRHWYDTNAVIGYAFVGVLFFAIARLARTSVTAPVSFGLAWFAIALLPTSSVFPLAEVANEHRLFFPLMGAIPALVWTAELASRRLPSGKRLLAVSAAVVAIALAAGTFVRNRTWRTEESLWRDVTEKSPGNGRGWMNYGLTQMEAGRYTAAKEAFDRAAQLTSSYSTLSINRGIVAAALGEADVAEKHFLHALDLNADRNSHFYYARWLVRSGRSLEALEHLAASSRAAPTWTPPRRLAMELSVALGNAAGARGLARSILQIDPTDQEAAAIARDGADLRCGREERCLSEGRAAQGDKQLVEAATRFRAAMILGKRSDATPELQSSLAALGLGGAGTALANEGAAQSSSEQ